MSGSNQTSSFLHHCVSDGHEWIVHDLMSVSRTIPPIRAHPFARRSAGSTSRSPRRSLHHLNIPTSTTVRRGFISQRGNEIRAEWFQQHLSNDEPCKKELIEVDGIPHQEFIGLSEGSECGPLLNAQMARRQGEVQKQSTPRSASYWRRRDEMSSAIATNTAATMAYFINEIATLRAKKDELERELEKLRLAQAQPLGPQEQPGQQPWQGQCQIPQQPQLPQ